ncbi:MAG TPA: fumarylacetoacetase [Actinomycetes bacterium]|nr:fumarylacetoacetase [Actinomycetes bacterium]
MSVDEGVQVGDTWRELSEDDPFGLQTLPFGSFSARHLPGPRVGVRLGDAVLDLTAASHYLGPRYARMFVNGSLDRFLASGPDTWSHVRGALVDWFRNPTYHDRIDPLMVSLADTKPRLPFTVADYVDFYASEHHATNLGRLFRPGQPPLPENWKQLPVGYHGRSGTVVVSGTPIVRPKGLRKERADGPATYGPSRKLDIEAEVGFVVGTPSDLGTSVPISDFERHVFGVCIVNDWSARDIQAFEYVPLGPFLGKSFATSISPWIVPLEAFGAARVAPPKRDPKPVAYLDDSDEEPGGLDITLEVELSGKVISRPPFASMYWTAAQQLAHLTTNGASLRTGDLYASGTVSGPASNERGSLIELTWNGERPLRLTDGAIRSFLEDGDQVTIRATAPGPGGTTVGLGEVTGRVRPSV